MIPTPQRRARLRPPPRPMRYGFIAPAEAQLAIALLPPFRALARTLPTDFPSPENDVAVWALRPDVRAIWGRVSRLMLRYATGAFEAAAARSLDQLGAVPSSDARLRHRLASAGIRKADEPWHVELPEVQVDARPGPALTDRFQLTDPAVRAELEDIVAEYVRGVDEATRRQIVIRVLRGLARDATPEDVKRELTRIFMDTRRAGLIARTELRRASQFARLSVFNKNGVRMASWRTQPGACDVCLANEDEGPVAVGSEYPSGDRYPPAHPNCRCELQAFSPDSYAQDATTTPSPGPHDASAWDRPATPWAGGDGGVQGGDDEWEWLWALADEDGMGLRPPEAEGTPAPAIGSDEWEFERDLMEEGTDDLSAP